MTTTLNRLISFGLVAPALLLSNGCGSNAHEQELIVYVSADDTIARQVIDAYTSKTGVQILWVGDTESTKTTGLVQRLLREKNNPVADVFWSSEILGTIQLSSNGVLVPCKNKELQQWPEEFRATDYSWFGFSPRARVIAYDPRVVEEDQLPEYWWECSEAVIADPRFGTTLTHVSVMAEYPELCKQLFSSMEGVPLLGGNAATVQAVVDGTATFAMTDSDDVFAAKQRGASIDMHYPRHHDGVGGGTLLIPNTVGVVKGTKKQHLAEDFVQFLLSDEIAILLATSTSHNFPIQPEVQRMFPDLRIDDPLQVDFAKAEKTSASQVAYVLKELSE